jgi:hypothetical protein
MADQWRQGRPSWVPCTRQPSGKRSADSPPPFSSSLSLFPTPFSYPGYHGPLNGLWIFLLLARTRPRQLFVLVILYFSAHRIHQGVRWLPPLPLRPTPLRIYLRKLHSDSYLRYRRQTQRLRLSRGLCLCYLLQFYPTFQTWGTDSPPVWLPPSQLLRVRRTQATTATTTATATATATRITRTRTTSVRYGCGHQRIAVSVPHPRSFIHRTAACTPSGSTRLLECYTTSARELAPRLTPAR